MSYVRAVTADFSVRLDLKPLRDFEEFADQFPFAISYAMNATAKTEAVDHMRDGLALPQPFGAGFTVRTPYTARGIRLTKTATKRDQTVIVGAISEYLLAATEGTADGTRPEGEHPIGAVPIGARRTKQTRLARRNDWPMRLIARGLAYRPGVDHRRKVRDVEGPLLPGRKRARAKDKPDPLQPGQILFGSRKSGQTGEKLWYIARDADTKIRPVYPALRLVREAFDAAFADNLRRAIKMAIASRRRR